MQTLFEKQTNYKESTILVFTIIVNTVLGLINILINYDAAVKAATEVGSSVIWIAVGVPITVLMLLLFYAVAYAMVTYFTAAAMQKGFDIKTFFRLAFRALAFLPLITLADMCGFLLIGKKFTDYGLVGLLSYIPFYSCLFLATYYLAPRYVNLDKKQTMILTVIVSVAMFFITYPYKG